MKRGLSSIVTFIWAEIMILTQDGSIFHEIVLRFTTWFGKKKNLSSSQNEMLWVNNGSDLKSGLSLLR